MDVNALSVPHPSGPQTVRPERTDVKVERSVESRSEGASSTRRLRRPRMTLQ